MVRSFLVARPRAITLVLFALLLATFATAVVAQPAHASGGACGGATWLDNPGTVYDNGDYRASAGSNFYDNWQGKYTHLNADIRSWRYTSTGSDGWPAGRCLRRIRVSGWVDDGSYGTVWLTWREWVCGTLVENGTSTQTFAGGQERFIGWTDYSGCGGPSADVNFHGRNADWTPYYPSEVPSPYINL
jgi:hypothetical protein